MKFPTSYAQLLPRVALLFASAWGAMLSGAAAQGGRAVGPGLKFHSLKFYEHGDMRTSPVGDPESGVVAGRNYASHFPISAARYITTELVFENLRHGKEAVEYEVMMGLYTFDNQLISVHKKRVPVAADWRFAWSSQSYGWPEAGRWSAGTYRVKVWLGDVKVGEGAIYLDDDSKGLPASVAGMSVEGLEFFEGGSFFRPGPSEHAAVTFARSKVRRIYWVLRGKNKLYRVRAQRPNLIGYFYRPDGTLLGEAANRFLLAPEVDDAVLVEGLGWATPGNWAPGRYRFELEQDHRVVLEKSFEITDPFLKPRERPQVIHYGIIGAGVFAGGEAPPPDEIGRKYQSRFTRGETENIWTELVVVNNPNHTEPHAHTVSWEYYQPDGSLLGKTETEFVIQPEWKIARQKASLGPGQKGKWGAGAYKVRLVIDGVLSRLVRFEVED